MLECIPLLGNDFEKVEAGWFVAVDGAARGLECAGMASIDIPEPDIQRGDAGVAALGDDLPGAAGIEVVGIGVVHVEADVDRSALRAAGASSRASGN